MPVRILQALARKVFNEEAVERLSRTRVMRKAAETAHRFVEDVKTKGVAQAQKEVLTKVLPEEKVNELFTRLNATHQTAQNTIRQFTAEARTEWQRLNDKYEAANRAAGNHTPGTGAGAGFGASHTTRAPPSPSPSPPPPNQHSSSAGSQTAWRDHKNKH